MNINDLIMRYGIVSRKRFRRGGKVRFLRGLQGDLKANGFSSKITQSKLRGESIYNLYVGDFKRAEHVIWTYFDTPRKSFSLYPYKIGKMPPKGKDIFALALPNLLLVLLGVAFYFLIGNNLQVNTDNIFQMVIFYGFYLILVGFMLFFKKGIANSMNLNRNSSGVVGVIQLMRELRKRKAAFAFVDFDCINGYGESMLKSYIGRDKCFIKLECIGSEEPVYILKDDEGRLEEVQEIEDCNNYIVCRAKKVQDDYVVEKTDTMKDAAISAQSIEEVVSMLILKLKNNGKRRSL